MVEDRDRDLDTVVSYLVGRHVTTTEIVEAMGISRSGYYVARSAGRLVTADHLVKLAKAFDLNPVDLMVRFGLLSPEAAIEYVDTLQADASARKVRGVRPKRLQRRPNTPPL